MYTHTHPPGFQVIEPINVTNLPLPLPLLKTPPPAEKVPATPATGAPAEFDGDNSDDGEISASLDATEAVSAQLREWVLELEAQRSTLPFEADGVVFKVDDWQTRYVCSVWFS